MYISSVEGITRTKGTALIAALKTRLLGNKKARLPLQSQTGLSLSSYMEDMYTDFPDGDSLKNSDMAAACEAETPESTQAHPLPKSGKPTPNNLAKDRFWGPILDPAR